MTIYRVMSWYSLFITIAIIIFGLTFAYLYHTRTNGAWRRSSLGRHLMAFVVVPTIVLLLALIRVHEVWWIMIRLAVYTCVPLVYLQRIRIFLKVQKENDVTGQNH
jgi:predicted membrane channel-forming protein YqfA (hemolysin III family)